MKALFALNKLSAAEKNFLKVKQLTGEYTPDEWLNLFTRLRDFDKQGDGTRKFGGWLGCGGIAVSFFSIFLIVIYVGLLTLPIGLLMAAVGLTIYFYIKRFDIPGEILTNAVLPIVKIMREEMQPGEKLKLRLDLRGFKQPEKLINQGQPYQKGAYYNIVDYFYKDQWIDGEALLRDGTKLIWSIFDLVKYSKKSKRTPRGKYKTKYKEKNQTLIQMQIAMHEKRYILPPKLKQKEQGRTVLTKKGDDYNWMSVRKMVKHPVGQKFGVHDFLDAVASAYVRATPVRGKK